MDWSRKSTATMKRDRDQANYLVEPNRLASYFLSERYCYLLVLLR